jgi:hypothetical protein
VKNILQLLPEKQLSELLHSNLQPLQRKLHLELSDFYFAKRVQRMFLYYLCDKHKEMSFSLAGQKQRFAMYYSILKKIQKLYTKQDFYCAFFTFTIANSVLFQPFPNKKNFQKEILLSKNTFLRKVKGKNIFFLLYADIGEGYNLHFHLILLIPAKKYKKQNDLERLLESVFIKNWKKYGMVRLQLRYFPRRYKKTGKKLLPVFSYFLNSFYSKELCRLEKRAVHSTYFAGVDVRTAFLPLLEFYKKRFKLILFKEAGYFNRSIVMSIVKRLIALSAESRLDKAGNHHPARKDLLSIVIFLAVEWCYTYLAKNGEIYRCFSGREKARAPPERGNKVWSETMEKTALSAVKEFYCKENLLARHFTEIDPAEYFSLIFSDKKEIPVVFGKYENHPGTVKRTSTDEIWKISFLPNAYISYCDFKNDYYRSSTLQKVRAFVADLDCVDTTTLEFFLQYNADITPQPTHIVNSGRGLHAVYLVEPVKITNENRFFISQLNRKIQSLFAGVFKVDFHPVVHPYRFPGFATKIGTRASVYRTGDKERYTFTELADVLQFKDRSNAVSKVLAFPTARRTLYVYVLRRLWVNPPLPGRRHNSFFGLGIVAYKCKREVPKDEALFGVQAIYQRLTHFGLEKGFSYTEALTAFHKGYKPEYVRASWKYLCSLFEWDPRPLQRRRGKRPLEEHLKYLQEKRQERKREVEKKIQRLLKRGYTKAEIARRLGMSRQNLYARYGHILNTSR